IEHLGARPDSEPWIQFLTQTACPSTLTGMHHPARTKETSHARVLVRPLDQAEDRAETPADPPAGVGSPRRPLGPIGDPRSSWIHREPCDDGRRPSWIRAQ